MIPDIASIARKRYRMRKTLRVAALTLATVWLVYTCTQLVELFFRGANQMQMYFVQQLVTSLAFLLGAGFLLAVERWWLAWVVPLPRPGCPACGYALAAPVPARCPECGVTLPVGLQPDDGPAPLPHEPQQ